MAAQFQKPMGKVGQVVPLFASITNEATVNRAVQGAAVVVNLVGILDADGILSFADFRVNERAFQLMEQVSGRAGRMDQRVPKMPAGCYMHPGTVTSSLP